MIEQLFFFQGNHDSQLTRLFCHLPRVIMCNLTAKLPGVIRSSFPSCTCPFSFHIPVCFLCYLFILWSLRCFFFFFLFFSRGERLRGETRIKKPVRVSSSLSSVGLIAHDIGVCNRLYVMLRAFVSVLTRKDDALWSPAPRLLAILQQ